MNSNLFPWTHSSIKTRKNRPYIHFVFDRSVWCFSTKRKMHFRNSLFVVLFFGLCFNVLGKTAKLADVEKRSAINLGGKTTEFARSFIEMFGPKGFNVKALGPYVERLAPVMGPVGPLFALLGSIFGKGIGDVLENVQQVKEILFQNFQEIRSQLNNVHQKLDKIYESLMLFSEFNKIETERSFLNSIEQSIADFNNFPENATRQALAQHCDSAMQAPAYVLQRLDEYVRKNYLPPHLKTALFEHVKTSVPKLVSVTKYIFADAVRSVAYQQTCLGLANASRVFQEATLKRDVATMKSIVETLIEWEQSLVPEWAVSKELEDEATRKLVEFGSKSKENDEKYGQNSAVVFYMGAAGELRGHLQKQFGNRTGKFQQVYFSVTIFDADYNHTLRVVEPYRAKVINTVLKRGNLEHNVKAVVSWIGFTESDKIDQLIEAKKLKYDQVTNYENNQTNKCFPKRSFVEKLTNELDNQELLLDLEPATLTMYSLDSNFARTGGLAYFLNVCGEVGDVIKDRTYMTIEF